jgi:heme/copper-type cytochrome/quinol oxidase subunit 4
MISVELATFTLPDNLSLCAGVCLAGVQAVVDALLLMHHLAATAEAPRKRRSVLSLVLLWLVLLLACVWWIYGRR